MSSTTQVPPEQEVPPEQQVTQPIEQQRPVQQAGPPPTWPPSQTQPPQPPERRHLKPWQWALIGVGIGIVVVLAIIGIVLGTRAQPTTPTPTPVPTATIAPPTPTTAPPTPTTVAPTATTAPPTPTTVPVQWVTAQHFTGSENLQTTTFSVLGGDRIAWTVTPTNMTSNSLSVMLYSSDGTLIDLVTNTLNLSGTDSSTYSIQGTGSVYLVITSVNTTYDIAVQTPR